ncbi:MAG: hypothetical protein ABRQ37_14990 [Candidatus Eremiobacterota bacterium]
MECSLHKLETSIKCSICNTPLCEECKKIENEKIQCSRCYIRHSMTVKRKKEEETVVTEKEEETVKPKKKEEKGSSYKTRKLPEVDPERIKLMIKNTQVKQLQEEEKKQKEPVEEVKRETVRKFCNWHDKRIAEYTCTKCQKTFCRDCLGEKKARECYCKSCWSSIKYSHLFNKKR